MSPEGKHMRLLSTRDAANVNVTLEYRHPLDGKPFPCPVCGNGLDIETTKARKPYCTCNSCGIQVFFRGKAGIERLQNLVENRILIAGNETDSVAVYNRLQQFRLQKSQLEGKQGLISRDEDLQNAIRAIDIEIKRLQGLLEEMAHLRKRRIK
jgi:hypothetical protein